MKDSPLYPILFMAVLAAVFAAAVSSVAVATRDLVRAGERARLRGHVLSAFGISAPENPEAIDELWGNRIEEKQPDGDRYYVATEEDGSLLGYGFPFIGPGFWGPIRGVVAVTPDGETLLGVSFTSHQETPGLGGRISEPWFQNQFRGKPTEPPPGREDPLQFVYREPEDPREVEAITGATQTSRRVDEFLNDFLVKLDRRAPLEGKGGNP